MEFVWDENKNQSNKEKHKIDFNDAKHIFIDINRIETEDNRKDYGEKRFITIGKVLTLIITVVYTLRNNTIRIISVRRADDKERKDYYLQQNKQNNDK